MGIGDRGMLAVGTDITQTALDTLKAMVNEESELVSIYYGKDVTKADAETLSEKAQEEFPELEIELHEGGQPIYYYLISAE